MKIKVEDDTVLTSLSLQIANIPEDNDVMTELHQIFADYMLPYVPMDEGILVGMAVATPEYVHYQGPHAHYQFEGVVYGPNIPIIENGVIVGWWSPPHKTPTGKQITYSTEKHPQATHHWHEAMMRDKSEPFSADVGRVIADRLNKGDK